MLREKWGGILLGLWGLMMIYFGVTDYLSDPDLDSVLYIGAGILGLVMAKQALVGSGEEGQRWVGMAVIALAAFAPFRDLLRDARADDVGAWIFVVTAGVMVLIAAIGTLIKLRNEGHQEESPPGSSAAAELQPRSTLPDDLSRRSRPDPLHPR